MLRVVLGGRDAAVVGRSAAGTVLVIVDKRADLVLADAALPESHSLRVGRDQETLAREAAALQTVLKLKRRDWIILSIQEVDICSVTLFTLKYMKT